MMKVLVLGGTGAMGRHLVELLAADGVEVTATSRAKKATDRTVTWLQGDPHHEPFLTELLRTRWDAIVDFMLYTTDGFTSRVERLLAATGQYVYISSARVYAGTDSVLTEESPRLLDVSKDARFLATDEYALAKARQENLLFDSVSPRWTVIRPYVTFSENRMQLGPLEKEGWLYRALQGRAVVFCKELESKFTTLTYGEDVARAIKCLIGNPLALREAFHITATASATWSEVVSQYSRVFEQETGRSLHVVSQPIGDFLRWHSAPYQVTQDRIFDRRFDNAKIHRHLAAGQFHDSLSTLRNCLKQFLRNPAFLTMDWKAEARKDKAVRQSSSLREMNTWRQRARYLKERYL